MIAFRELMEGRVLYHDMSALYGPFYYFVLTPLFSYLTVPLSHDTARLISIVFWFGCAAIFATVVWRLTHSNIATAFSLLTALLLLKLFVLSPLHPQELSFVLVGILLHLVISVEKTVKPMTLLLLGAIAAGLFLTKINLAAFVILPLILAALRTTGNHLRAIHGIVLALGILMPVVLMAPLLHLEWVIRYCIFASLTILATLVVWSSIAVPEILTIRAWGFFVAGFAAVVLLTIGATMAGGTSALEIFRAMVLQNFDLVRNWHYEVTVNNAALAVAAVSAGYAVYFARFWNGTVDREIAIGRVMRLKGGLAILGVVAIAIAAIFGTPWEAIPSLMFQFLVPFAWLLMVTDENAEHSRPLVRGVFGLIAAFLVLYAFPVHGAQTTLAGLLPTVMLPVLLNDAMRHARLTPATKVCKAVSSMKPLWRGARGAALAYGLMLTMLGSQTVAEWRQYSSLEPLDLPGSSLIRTDRSTIQLHHWVIGELRKCPAFYLLPSLPSFYFWAEQRTPSGIMNNNTFGLLSSDQQRHAIADLEQNAQLCILTIPYLLQKYDRGQLATRPPLLQYVEETFIQTQSMGPFRLLRRKGSE
jgi:hypothetical protein